MNEDHIKRSLLEIDGSCRDINLSEHISTAGAVSLLDVICARWTLMWATDTEGVAVQPEDIQALLAKGTGTLSTLWNGLGSPSHFQAFFHWTEADMVFVELTFFPQDLDAQQFTLADFLKMLESLVNAAQSQEYYVRFEDGAWRHADGSAGQSVIFSHEDMALLAKSSDH